jgi:hypothetical protein
LRERCLNIEATNETFSTRVNVLEKCRYYVSYYYYWHIDYINISISSNKLKQLFKINRFNIEDAV